MIFPIFTIIAIFVITVSVYRAILTKKREEKEEEFWSREEEAEHTPPVDLSTLEYVKFPAKGFHLAGSGEEAEQMEEELMELSQKPLMNLSGMTNTDLKITYGTSNFEKMQEIGENFDRLVILLTDYGKLLIELGQPDDAIEVLEFGISIGTDISTNYTLLGDCYEKKNEPDKIAKLIEKVDKTDLLLKQKILDSLNENLNALNGEPSENFDLQDKSQESTESADAPVEPKQEEEPQSTSTDT